MSVDRVLAVIPAYEPSEELPRLVAGLVAAGLRRVLVVDDGSSEHFGDVFADTSAAGAQVVRHDVNRGKGVALRTALAHALEHGLDLVGVVTADADGQHTVHDIHRVAQELAARQGDARVCVLGQRDFDLPDIPLRSRFGNKVTTGIIRLLYGRHLPDTQTGLRGLSLDLLPELLGVRGDRFDHEMRVLMHLLASRAEIVAVPIETVYEGGQNTTSHFRPLRDSAIIYAALLRQLGSFVVTSVLGFVVDIAVFVLVIDLAFDGHPTVVAVGVSTVAARVVSVATNYTANHLVVFRSGARVHRSATRYAALAVGLVLASWVLTTGVSHLLGHHVVWAKLIVDTGLFFVSYLVQRRWVFRADLPGAAPTPGSRPDPTGRAVWRPQP